MDQEDQEEVVPNPFEYVMPLSGSNPRMNIDAMPPLFEVSQEFSQDSGGFQNHRRKSNQTVQTDATPRFENITRSDADESYTSPRIPRKVQIPDLPLYDIDSQKSQKSMASHTTAESYGGGCGSISSTSTPVSPAASNSAPANRPQLQMKTNLDPSVMQINMDGSIREVPIKSSRTMSSDSTSSNMAPSSRKSGLSSIVTNESASVNELNDRDEDNDAASSEDYNSAVEPIVIWNMTLPMWLSRLIKKPPSLSIMAVFIVSMAPCFWCSSTSIQGGSTGTNRAVLTRLNVLCIFITFVQFVAACWLGALLLIVDDAKGFREGFEPHFWNLNGAAWSVGILAFVLIVTCLCTIRVIKEVDLVGAIRYLWLVLWLLPFESFFTISLFDAHQVTEVWVRHWWLQPEMSYFLYYFCLPPGTDSNKCLVPIDGGEYKDEDEWCRENYNSEDCEFIRDEAQKNASFALMTFYFCLAASGCVLLLLMFLMVDSLESIISKPMVQKSRETNVPLWLLLPTVGTALVGAVLVFAGSSALSKLSTAEGSWIGRVYLVAAALFLVAMLMGWFLSTFSIQNNIDKKNKSIAVVILIGVMAANTVMLATIFVGSLYFSGKLLVTGIKDEIRGEIACIMDKGVSCTNCPDGNVFIPGDFIPGEVCLEWTMDEVIQMLQTQFKQSATLAAIFIVYSISVLRFGFVLRKHLAMYQIDYV